MRSFPPSSDRPSPSVGERMVGRGVLTAPILKCKIRRGQVRTPLYLSPIIQAHFPRANCDFSCIALRMNKTSGQFEGLLSRYFETLLEDVPTFAAAYAGLPSGEGKLGRLTPDFHQQRERKRQAALRA